MKKLLIYFLKTISYRLALTKAKQQGVLLYLKTLQVARKSILASLLIFTAFQLMILGFLGTVISGIWLLPLEDLSIKIWILFGFFTILFLVPVFVLIYAFSEKTWMRLSGAEDLIKTHLNSAD